MIFPVTSLLMDLYDCPLCVLFIVDNHIFWSLCYEVLDDDPTLEDITLKPRCFYYCVALKLI